MRGVGPQVWTLCWRWTPSRLANVLFKHLQAWHLERWAGIRRADAWMHWRTVTRSPDSHLLPVRLSHAPPCIPDWCNPWGLKHRSQWPWEFNEERWRKRYHSISGPHSEVLPWPFKLLLNGPKQFYSNAKGTLSSGSHAVLLCWPLCSIGVHLAVVASAEDPEISETNKGDKTILIWAVLLNGGFSQNIFRTAPLGHIAVKCLPFDRPLLQVRQSNSNKFWAITTKDIKRNTVSPKFRFQWQVTLLHLVPLKLILLNIHKN